MRLDTCLLADAADATPDGKLFIHGGGISRITPPVLPWVHPTIAVVLRFEMDDEDPGRAHVLTIDLRTASDESVLPDPPSLTLNLGRPTTVAGEPAYAQAAIQLAGLKFETAGLYHFSVVLDGEEIASPRLAVIAPGELRRSPNRAARRSSSRPK